MPCTRCQSTGRIHDTPYTWTACPKCKGKPEVTIPEDRPTLRVRVVCPACDGSKVTHHVSELGVAVKRTCATCEGEGEVHPAVARIFQAKKKTKRRIRRGT